MTSGFEHVLSLCYLSGVIFLTSGLSANCRRMDILVRPFSLKTSSNRNVQPALRLLFALTSLTGEF